MLSIYMYIWLGVFLLINIINIIISSLVLNKNYQTEYYKKDAESKFYNLNDKDAIKSFKNNLDTNALKNQDQVKILQEMVKGNRKI